MLHTKNFRLYLIQIPKSCGKKGPFPFFIQIYIHRLHFKISDFQIHNLGCLNLLQLLVSCLWQQVDEELLLIFCFICRFERNLTNIEKDVTLLCRKVVLVSDSAPAKIRQESTGSMHQIPYQEVKGIYNVRNPYCVSPPFVMFGVKGVHSVTENETESS